jgi:hypothetical protein
MIAVNSWTPNIPKLEMVKDPPWYSSGLSFPSRALPAKDLTSEEMLASPLAPASLTIGVIKPVGVATAIQMSAFLYLERNFESISHIVQRTDQIDYLLPDNVAQPSRVGLGYLCKSQSGSLDDYKIVVV